MRSRFDEQLSHLNAELIEMGTLIEYAIEHAAQALTSQDVPLARSIIEFDREIDQIERDIEALCMKLLLHQQPVAKDLRFISSALKMITDMERIGDQAADISEIVVMMAGAPSTCDTTLIPEMARATIGMVHKAIDAFVTRDMKKAQAVIASDDVVDDLFDRVKDQLTAMIRDGEGDGVQIIEFLMIAKYFERIGDHATNIAEWVEFALTGIHKGEDGA